MSSARNEKKSEKKDEKKSHRRSGSNSVLDVDELEYDANLGADLLARVLGRRLDINANPVASYSSFSYSRGFDGSESYSERKIIPGLGEQYSEHKVVSNLNDVISPPLPESQHEIPPSLPVMPGLLMQNLVLPMMELDLPMMPLLPMIAPRQESVRVPLDTKEFKELKRVNYGEIKNEKKLIASIKDNKSEQKHEAKHNDMCPICQTEFKDSEPIIILPCHHIGHIDCITPWLTQYNHTCPICKSECGKGSPMLD